uniref:Uncharacterized protein n=1 Tax=Dechloromonas aromatica (strain RCB) TaxID=159087 RepID=Q47D46_DECAR
MDYDNPAARLLAILEEGQQKDANQNCRQTWNELLKTGNDHAVLMSRLGHLFALPEQITQAIDDNFPTHRKNCTHWESQVRNAFYAQVLNGNWSSFIGQIDSHTISYLGFTAELLQTKANTKSIADDQILEVRAKIDELYQEVLTSNIPSEVKTYLTRYLRKILNSIDEYFLTGALPILEATGTLLGHAFVDENYRSFLKNEKLGNRIFECLTAMANVITVAVGLPQLTQALALLK